MCNNQKGQCLYLQWHPILSVHMPDPVWRYIADKCVLRPINTQKNAEKSE